MSHDEVRITLLESQVVVALLVVGGGTRSKQPIDRLIVAESSRVLPIRASLIKQLHGRARQTSDDCDVASFNGRTSKIVHRLRQHFPNGVKWTRLTLSLFVSSLARANSANCLKLNAPLAVIIFALPSNSCCVINEVFKIVYKKKTECRYDNI